MAKPELSQAERTAEQATWAIYQPESLAHGPATAFGKGFHAGRDYGRERERALRGALDQLFDAAKPYLDKAAPYEQLFDGEDFRNFEALSKAIVQADAALADSPREPEGQPETEPRSVLRMQAYTRGVCPVCSRAMSEPDHGPGESSEAMRAVIEAATILRKITPDCGEHDPKPIPLDVRMMVESWLAAHLPPAVGESNG